MKSLFRYGIACALDQPSQEAPIILRGDIKQIAPKAKEIGYGAIELQIRVPQNYDWKNLLRTAKQRGLEFCAIATGRELAENGLSLISDDAGIRRAAIDKLKIHIGLGAALGCMVIVGSMRSKIPDMSRYRHYEDFLTEAKLELADYARYCADKLEYVHFSDSDRYYPGGGNGDFKTFMKALLDVGYSGYIATESDMPLLSFLY